MAAEILRSPEQDAAHAGYPERVCYGGPYDGETFRMAETHAVHVWRRGADLWPCIVAVLDVKGRTPDGWAIVREASDPDHVGVYAPMIASFGTLLRWYPDPTAPAGDDARGEP